MSHHGKSRKPEVILTTVCKWTVGHLCNIFLLVNIFFSGWSLYSSFRQRFGGIENLKKSFFYYVGELCGEGGGAMNHQEFMYILRLVNFSLITFTGLHHLNFKSAIQNSCKNKRCMVFEWRKPGIHRVNKCQDHFVLYCKYLAQLVFCTYCDMDG